MKNQLKLTSLFSAGLLLSCSPYLSAQKKEKKPNILFIITDQQFAEAMSCRMGNQFLKTPNMDKMAAEGVIFTQAYCSNPISVPSRSSMFTGRYTHETGMTRNPNVKEPVPEIYNSSLPNMGQYFQQAGYRTAYYGKSHLMYELGNVKESGFENVIESENDSVVSVDAVNYLKTKPSNPFLLVASFTNPHNVCEYARNLRGKNQPLSCGEIGYPTKSDSLPPVPFNLGQQRDEPDGLALLRTAYQTEGGQFPVGGYSATEWRKLRWGYYRMIEKVDAQIGLILQTLKNMNLDENTLIVFTSDHGECAGAHGWNQKTVFYEESTRVPFIIRYKGKVSASINNKLVNTGIDILPTILDFAGRNTSKKLPGKSLNPLTTGNSTGKWRKYVVVENHLAQASGLVNGKIPELEGRMVRTARYKYCVYSKGNRRESLVDLQNDPGEMINLATNPKFHDVLLQHRTLLLQFGKQYNDSLALKLLENNVQALPF
jgi:arylsulfatase A-like enzyme